MGLTEQGYHRPTYDEILEDRISLAKNLFGEDIETDEKTPLGKFIRIGAYDLSKAYEDIENVYYARFPNTANGTSLDRLCVFAGITRNPATQALHDIRVYGEVGTVIGIGELVVSSGDITFYSANEYTIPEAGNVTVVVECSEAGTIGNVDTITDIVNPTAEIEKIEYIGMEQAGLDEETDIELRKRFSVAVEGAGSTNENAIRAALLRVPNVKSAGIITNETDDTDSKGRPARSFECYVYTPGVDETEQEEIDMQIAETIFDKAPIGIKTCTTSAKESDKVEKTILDDGGYEHTIYFSRTEEIAVYVKMEIVTDAKFEVNGDEQIKNAIVSYIDSLGVGADVVLSTLYGHIHSVAGVVAVTDLTLSTDGTDYSAESITINEWQAANTDAEKVEVNKADETV